MTIFTLKSHSAMCSQWEGIRLPLHRSSHGYSPYCSYREFSTLFGKKPWEVPHLDTLQLWKFGDYKHYTSLALSGRQYLAFLLPKTI